MCATATSPRSGSSSWRPSSGSRSSTRRSRRAWRASRSPRSPAIGFVLVVHLATHGYDRAVMLIPTWLLLLAWVAAAGFTVTGQLTNDLVPPALDRRPGADRHADRLHGHAARLRGRRAARRAVSDAERRALALAGAGDIVFDWDVAGRPDLCQPRGRAPARPQARRRSRARPPTGSTCSIPSTATATAPPSTR